MLLEMFCQEIKRGRRAGRRDENVAARLCTSSATPIKPRNVGTSIQYTIVLYFPVFHFCGVNNTKLQRRKCLVYSFSLLSQAERTQNRNRARVVSMMFSSQLDILLGSASGQSNSYQAASYCAPFDFRLPRYMGIVSFVYQSCPDFAWSLWHWYDFTRLFPSSLKG